MRLVLKKREMMDQVVEIWSQVNESAIGLEVVLQVGHLVDVPVDEGAIYIENQHSAQFDIVHFIYSIIMLPKLCENGPHLFGLSILAWVLIETDGNTIDR